LLGKKDNRILPLQNVFMMHCKTVMTNMSFNWRLLDAAGTSG